MHMLEIPRPYLIFIGDNPEPLDVKTGLGILEWRPDWCMGQYRFDGGCDLGLRDFDPHAAAAAGAATMVVGGASFGGKLPPNWEAAIAEGIEAGLNVASGLHDRLHSRPHLVERAAAKGVRLFDVRSLPPGFSPPVASGVRRNGKRILTVGTDCAVGKKFTALALERDMRAMGMKATFRATGQTGVLISGGGLAIDAIVADFLAGAVELLSPDNDADHWDVIEGQGSLFHPAYAAVSLGLLHGSQPDAFVVCHEAKRDQVLGYEAFPTPDLQACIDLHIANGRRLNPDIRCIGVSLNTSQLTPEARAGVLAAVEERLGLPCVDPAVTGTKPLIAQLTA
ncbi:MAG: DUF1611 domain-containing protein [Alphaproteobacteria bacterium]|nr:DUF1611 domain-containing protein [Alphaproteobacteria bacterium]